MKKETKIRTTMSKTVFSVGDTEPKFKPKFKVGDEVEIIDDTGGGWLGERYIIRSVELPGASERAAFYELKGGMGFYERWLKLVEKPKENSEKGIYIKFEKVWVHDRKMIKVLELKARSWASEPEVAWMEYLSEKEHFVYRDGACPRFSCNKDVILAVGEIYMEKTFAKKLAFIEKCGKNLARINKEDREKKEAEAKRVEWSGVEEITI